MNLNDLDPGAVANKEETLAALVEDKYEIDASIGTTIRELLIRPMAALGVQQDETYNTFLDNMTLKAASTNEDLSDEYIDALVSNYRITRKAGSFASGVLGIYTQQTTPVYIQSSDTFTYNGIEFIPLKTYVGVLNPETYTNTDAVEYKQLTKFDDDTYVFTVPVEALVEADTQVARNTDLIKIPASTKISSIQTVTPIIGGTDTETNAELIERAMTGLTAAVPSGREHYKSLFSDNLHINVKAINAFGVGDVEMKRDKLSISGVSTGGCADVYCRTALLPIRKEIVKQGLSLGNNKWSIVIDNTDAPGFYSVDQISNGVRTLSGLDIEYTYGSNTSNDTNAPRLLNDSDARYTCYQTAVLKFDFEEIANEQNTAPFVVTLSYMPNLDTLQTYVNSRDVSNPSQDTLIKAPVPSMVGVAARVTHAPGLTTVTQEELQQAIAQEINTLSIDRPYISATDIVRAVLRIDNSLLVEFPITLSSTTYTTKGSYKKSTTHGYLPAYIDEDITARGSCFYCYAEDVSIELQERTTAV